MSKNIEQSLKDRFAAPLPENYKRRIIFWQDPDGEFAAQVDELCPGGVKLLKLTGMNNFAAKMLLSETDLDSNYLVYNPLSYSDIRDNWLLDIELYSEEFRADLLSIRMQELNMPNTSRLRKAMKAYSKFFDNKERVAKLSAFKSKYDKVGQLHIDILAVLSGASANTAPGVIKAILLAGLDTESNEAIANIKKFGNESVLWELINRYTGYVHSEEASLISLAGHILLTALSVTMKPSCLSGLEQQISEAHQQLCYDLTNEWMHSEEDDALYEIAREIQEVEKTGIQLEFPSLPTSSTALVLKKPKTATSIRKVFVPKTVAKMLKAWKEDQDEVKELMGDAYHDYGLVFAGPFGLPTEQNTIAKALKKLIEKHGFPPIVFHSFRHASVTYKLKLNGGDIKAVQGDTGHAQSKMVSDVYSHILDEGRKHNAQLFEKAFYSEKAEDDTSPAGGSLDVSALQKLLANPKAAALLAALAKSLK